MAQVTWVCILEHDPESLATCWDSVAWIIEAPEWKSQRAKHFSTMKSLKASNAWKLVEGSFSGAVQNLWEEAPPPGVHSLWTNCCLIEGKGKNKMLLSHRRDSSPRKAFFFLLYFHLWFHVCFRFPATQASSKNQHRCYQSSRTKLEKPQRGCICMTTDWHQI